MEPYRVWVGCLACYNEGNLVGDWFDADMAPQEVADFDEAVKTPASHKGEQHDELWVFDHENSPAPGEYSPMDAAAYAEILEDFDGDMDTLREWLNGHGETLTTENLETYEERLIGEDLGEYVAECYDEDELPDWARSCFGTIVDGIIHDMKVGGDVERHNGTWFRTH